MDDLAKRINELLKKEQLTQKQLAYKIGVTESSLCYYLQGKRVQRSDVLIRLAVALGTTTDYLLGLDDNKNYKDEDLLSFIRRSLGKLDPEQLKTAYKMLNICFDTVFPADKVKE